MTEENISQEINNEENIQETEETNAQDLVEETIPVDAEGLYQFLLRLPGMLNDLFH